MAGRTKIHYSSSPRVDLLPDAQRAERHHQETLPKLLLALVGSAVVAGLIWGVGTLPVMLAQQTQAQLNNESQSLAAEIAEYDEAQRLLNAVGSRESDRQALTSTEVLFAGIYERLAGLLPEGTSIARFGAQLPEASEAAGVFVDPECAATGVQVTLAFATASAAPLQLAADFLDDARDLDGFLCGNVVDSNVTASGESAVTLIQMTMTFDESVRSGRFAEGTDS